MVQKKSFFVPNGILFRPHIATMALFTSGKGKHMRRKALLWFTFLFEWSFQVWSYDGVKWIIKLLLNWKGNQGITGNNE